MVHNYPWSLAYASAVLETDPSKGSDRVQEAEQAIEWRLFDPELDSNELRAIEAAVAALKALKRK